MVNVDTQISVLNIFIILKEIHHLNTISGREKTFLKIWRHHCLFLNLKNEKYAQIDFTLHKKKNTWHN